ncbi:MAG: type II toxin-antitoxin system VapC family toxin [Chloroflexota bacterium]
MTLYVDSSALVKRYVEEPDSALAEGLLLADPAWITASHTFVEVMLTLARRLASADLPSAQQAFEADWSRTLVIAVDAEVCRRAAAIGIETETRSLDALHLAAAERAGGRQLRLLTFDVRLADAARALGYPVIGA